MSSALTATEIARDARWLVQALDHNAGVARLVAMDPEAYRNASFLDDRMFQQPTNAQLMPWTTLEEAVPLVGRNDSRWIFHIGHVGSTLLARLLGELPTVLSIREPRSLRDVTAVSADKRVAYATALRTLFSRTFAPAEVTVVKATSFVSEIAPELTSPDGRALFMYATPRNYVASILAGENSVQELRMLAPIRAERLAGRDLRLPPPRHDADHAAIAWACEMTSLEAGAKAMPDRRIGWIDFDRMLDDLTSALSTAAELIGIAANPDQLARIAAGPLVSRYSKALEYEYSPKLRRDLIEQATREHRADIKDALAMLNEAAEKSRLLARAVERSGED